MSSPNHSTSNIEDAFSSMNILNYTSVSPDYFPASAGSRSFNSSENSTDNIILPVFSSFYNNPYLKDVQAFYAKELPISSPDPEEQVPRLQDVRIHLALLALPQSSMIELVYLCNENIKNGQKRCQKVKNRAREWKECKKSKPKAYTSLMGQPVPILLGRLQQIVMLYNGLTLSHRDTINAAAGGTFMQKTLEECYELIENMTAHHNHWDTSATRDETSRNISSTTTESPKVVRQLELMNKNFVEMMRQIQSVKSVNPKCETCGGPHSFTECSAADGYTQ
ncbi:hypothetical protein Tco_0266572 [Tanacetum coccineum]